MQEGSLVLTILILLCTLLPALVPSVFLIFTNSHISTQILAPICYSLGQQTGEEAFDHKVCLSCYVKDEIAEPFKLKITHSNSELYSNPETHNKRIISFHEKVSKLSSLLSCQDIAQLMNINTHTLSFTDLIIEQINFEEDIPSVKEIINSLDMRLSPQTKKEKNFIEPSTEYFAVMQLIKIKADSSQNSEIDPLIEVSFPSKKYKTDFLELVDIFCKASLVFCLIAFVFKRFSEKITSYEMFACGTVIFGFFVSFRNEGLNTNNFYYKSSEFLYLAICLRKVEVLKELGFAYLLIQIITPFVITEPFLLELLEIGFYLFTTILIFIKSRKLKEQEHLCLYMSLVWSLLTVMVGLDDGEKSFIFVFAHSTILILSTSGVEFLTKGGTEQFEELIAVSKFTEIKSFEEMEEISELN